MSEDNPYVEGSFNWYKDRSGGFVQAVAQAIIKADNHNLERLRKAFPQMVAAHECHSWDDVPEGYEPKYNGELTEEEKIKRKIW